MGISAGFADLAIGMFTGRSGFDSLGPSIVPLLATAVCVAALFLLLGAGAVLLLRGIARVEASAALLATGVFLFSAVALLSIRDLLTALLDLPEDGRRAELVLFLLFSLLVAAGALFVLVRAPSSKAPALVLLVSAPLFLSETAIALWLWTEAFGSLSLLQKMAFAAGFLAVVAASFVICRRLLLRFPSGLAIAGVAAAALMLPLAVAAPGLSRHGDHGAPERRASVRRVILIVVDTLRADALSSYGNTDVETPHLDELARGSFVFRNAYSSASWTLPSMSSLLTGLFPSVHLTTKPASRLPGKLTTLPEYLGEAGYLTGAIGDNSLLRRRSNLAQGFQEYDFYPKRTSSDFGSNLLSTYSDVIGRRYALRPSTEDLTALAQQWIERHEDRDFFLWLHYFDPHLPYSPPERFRQDKGEWGLEHLRAVRVGYRIVPPKERKRVRGLYQSEVLYVDEQIGRLLEFLKERDLYEDSLIVLTSDHGEEFWDHEGIEHGHRTWNEILHVPLMVKTPRGASIGSYDGPVPTVGLMPTILDLCGVSYDRSGLSVSSLEPLLRSQADSYQAGPLFATSTLYFEEQDSIIADGMKYTRSKVTGKESLYDLAADPGERRSLVDTSVADLERMRALFSEMQASAAKLRARHGLSAGEEGALSPGEVEQLRSLGYVQ